jgi:hypothetical protein
LAKKTANKFKLRHFCTTQGRNQQFMQGGKEHIANKERMRYKVPSVADWPSLTNRRLVNPATHLSR